MGALIEEIAMTQLLEKAFSEASNLPDIEQNILANWLLMEFSSEKRWNQSFAESEDLLAELSAEALKEHNNKKTQPLDLNNL
jgi:replication fork clamp-binding protein CrfC